MVEAYRSLLSLYEVAKIVADRDASVAHVARPLAELFSQRQTGSRSSKG